MTHTTETILESTALCRLMRELHDCGFIAWNDKPFTLKSGIESHVYVQGREDITDRIGVLSMLGRTIGAVVDAAREQGDERRICLIGIPTAATPLAIAAAFERPGTICFRIMRETRKGHGAHQGWVNGLPDPARHLYATVENVVTSGDSVRDALARLVEDGYPVREMRHFVLVDREQGGMGRLREAGFQAEAIFTLRAIAGAFHGLGLWSEKQVEAIEHEVRAHQFA